MGNLNREEFIRKLENVQNVFREIKDKDKRRLVIRYEDRNVLEKLVRSNERMIQKLQKHEFAVAVVGLEKAGKSTLANALLNLIVLPEYTERCTYTTTEIRSGSNDVAEVHFYSKERFENNFREMLKAVGYPNETTYEELEPDEFDYYWRQVRQNNQQLFERHNGTTVEDIRAVLNAKDAIDYLTGKEPEVLNVKDDEDYEKLYRYITGIADYSGGHVERVADPYAVEKVLIKSTGLTDMKNIILYDVPGFDSPTELHKKQTEDMLKMSDAIILVTNVGSNPNLTGTQLDMLQKGRDADGIALSDKVFVFGNKLDLSGNRQVAEDNASALMHDAVDKYKIAQRDRVVCGSAKAYLEKQGLQSRDDVVRGGRDVASTLSKLGIEDGIGELKSKMQHYYDNDRFDVLKRRADKTIEDAKRFLNSVLSKYDSASDTIDDGGQYLLQAKDALEDFSKKASELSRDYRRRINDEQPFSSLIRKNLEEIYPSETLDSMLVSDVENRGIASDIYALSRVDAAAREQLSLKFRKNIVTRTANATQSMEAEIYQRLAEELLDSLKSEAASTYRQELETRAKELFQSLLIENGEHCWFNPLIERYATELIETLIKCPYSSSERLQRLIDPSTMPDFQSLAMYCDVRGIDNPLDKQKYFFAKILTHDDVRPPEAAENETALRNFFEEYNANLAAGFDFDKLPFGMWSVLLTKLGINVAESDLLERLKKALINFVGVAAWAKLPPSGKNRRLESAILDYCVRAEPQPLSDYVKALADTIRGIETKDEMIMIINEDIEILRELTLKAVVSAMGLERAFNSIMAKNIDMIRESINTASGKEIFNRWLNENMRRIRASEYEAIDKQQDALKDKRAIAASIRQVLAKLD